MPNWVSTKIKGLTRADVINYISIDKNGDEFIDFNKIIPMPDELNISDSTANDRIIDIIFDKKFSLKNLSHREKQTHINDAEKDELISIVETMIENIMLSRNILSSISNANKYISSEFINNLNSTINELKNTRDNDIINALRALRNCIKYDAPTWYRWSITNWGTKWNSTDCSINNDEIKMLTAWDSPRPILDFLARTTKKNITVFCADEMPNFVYKLEYKNGSITSIVYYDGVQQIITDDKNNIDTVQQDNIDTSEFQKIYDESWS